LQVMLFGATSGGLDPDYVPVPMHKHYALLLGIASLIVVVVGGLLSVQNTLGLFLSGTVAGVQAVAQPPSALPGRRPTSLPLPPGKGRREGRRDKISRGFPSPRPSPGGRGRNSRRRRLGWISMLCVAVVSNLIVATQRPRPEYLYSLSVFLMILVATCAMAILGRLRIDRWGRAAAPLVMVLPIFLARSTYGTAKHHPPRPIAREYERLRPYRSLLARPDTVLVSEYPFEAGMYLGLGLPKVYDYSEFDQMPVQQELAEFLRSRGVNLILIDGKARELLKSRHPEQLAEFERRCGVNGWKLIGRHDNSDDRWTIFQSDNSPVR